ncbi:MAG TPA: ABC transporter substrate-binding protein [Actinophytocola sp.]|uniref:ABC transporter substrate-binding protein n=1 Tax=Actinophytocola sp. TaxID=1872138 RepID=UPI002DB9C783|nr:ABC transporter substrate-binding protein [Actinophytocola sp.]HEU5469074.1 ABC transporter substrate-binding protein [Actinophytocola sp.]
MSRRTFLSASGALLLAGCASGEENTAARVEVPEVRLGVLAVPDTAPLYLAQRQGIFERAGLRPKMVESQLTGDNRFDLENGSEDIHFDSWVTIFLNIADGADWVLVGEAYQTSTNTSALLTRTDSKLRDVQDLRGTRIGVNNPNGLGTMLINALLSTRGISPSEVRYVEIPFDKIGAAIKSGQVDSGWLVEPYLTTAQLENGAVPFADTAAGATVELPQSGYVCARSFAERNPQTIKAFQAALVQAQVEAADRTAIERELIEYLKVNNTVAALMNMGTYPSSLRAVRPQRVADLMRTQGTLKKDIDVSKLVING